MKFNTKINIARHILFWSWNIIFIVFVNLGLMPMIGPDILYGLRMGTINKDVAAFLAVVLAVPIAASFLGFVYSRRDSKKLFALMYCIELPLFAIALFRLFFIRELTAGVDFFLILFAWSSIYLGYRLFSSKATDTYKNLAGATVFLWCGAWIFLMVSFLIPPMGYAIVEGVKSAALDLSKISFENFLSAILSSAFSFFLMFTGAIFFAYTATLFILFPLIYVFSAFKNWQSVASTLWRRSELESKKIIGVSLLTAVSITSLFIVTTRQNHESVLAKLQAPIVEEIDKTEIGNNEKYYRSALRDIYLAPYRYMGDQAETNFVQAIYLRTFKASPNSTAWIQALFNQVARPFIYRGTSHGMDHDQQLAERLYRDLFDASIQEDERESIRYAVQSTYSREQIDAGLININEKKVHLDKQVVSILENGEWADLEIHEVYSNLSFRPEEIFLHLKLPQGAVINGMWLGDDETNKFAATVAPRGAAQKVYTETVERGADPALVEQVGPQLYRLRVFPIPPNDVRYRAKKVMHMWLSLRLLKQKDTAWEMPMLTEKRNLYWDSETLFFVNGTQSKKGEAWLPEEIPIKQSSTPTSLRYPILDKTIAVQPILNAILSKECSFTVLIDTSLSMRTRKREILDSIESIDRRCNQKGVEYYVWNKGLQKFSSGVRDQIEKQVFWGVFDSIELARNFSNLETDKKSVVVLTDKTFFRENEQIPDYSAINKPIWFLLLDNHYPRSINDSLLKKIYEIGGGLETKINAVFAAIDRHEYKASQKDIIDIDSRYVWRMSKNTTNLKTNEPAEALVAHKLILNAVESGLTKTGRELDQLQKIALQSHVVSPYSSMIVLIDDSQRKLLEQAEKDKDRFDRKVETGKERLTSPKAPFEATAVPEPGEWALIMAVLGFLLIHNRRKGFNLCRLYGTTFH